MNLSATQRILGRLNKHSSLSHK